MSLVPPFRPLTMEETALSLEKMIGIFTESAYGEFVVIERKEKRVIGKCGLQQLENSGLTELQFTFTPDALAKGYAVEASMEVLRSAFNDWGLEKIVAIAQSNNRHSLQVIERIGMHYEQYCRFYNREMILYSLEKPKESTDSIFERSYQNSPRLMLHEV